MVDPGGDIDRIKAAIEKMGAKVEKILLTHGHMDHCAAADAATKVVPIEGPERVIGFGSIICPNGARCRASPWLKFEPDRWLVDGDTVTVSALSCGYSLSDTPGHVVFFDGAQRLAWVGDVIFGLHPHRLSKGNHDELIHSIREKLFPLGDNVQFVPGHGRIPRLVANVQLPRLLLTPSLAESEAV